jgi:hypothetical protein
MVTCGIEELSVYSHVLWTLIHWDCILVMGRTSGNWTYRQTAGAFCCGLSFPPLSAATNRGAWYLRRLAVCRCVLLQSTPSSVGACFSHWGDNGHWRYGLAAGSFYCSLNVIPSGPASHLGAYLSTYGRNSGDWGNRRAIGAFYCSLGSPPSGPIINFGANLWWLGK